MKKFVAEVNGGSYINIPADKMETDGDFLCAWKDNSLVAIIDRSILLMARIDDVAVMKE